jgi:DNA-binding response OmpR family regulator
MKEETQKKILIIEDEKPLAHALVLKLSHEGFEVVTTNSGEEGISLIEKENFSLVLTDLILPGQDGFKVLEAMQNKKNQEEDQKKATDLGATHFFVKSNTTISEIVENVKNAVNSA